MYGRLWPGLSFVFDVSRAMDALNSLSFLDTYSTGPTRTDGGGPWNYKPIRRHRKLKGYMRSANARRR